jgi:co-chaperonin GroES (HSP10)
MKPIWANVLIRVKKAETKVGGIVIPGQENNKTSKAEILSVGEEVEELKVGQTVWVSKEKLLPIEVSGETLYVCDKVSVLGVCS